MTISQEQYDAYVRAEDAYYLRRFTTREYASYDAVLNLLHNARNRIRGRGLIQEKSILDLASFYSSMSFVNNNPQVVTNSPQDRLHIRSIVYDFLYYHADSSLGNLESISEYFPESQNILDLINSIKNTPPFTPPAGSPADFYSTYIGQSLNPTPSSSTPSPPVPSSPTSGSTTSPTSTSPTASQPTSPVPNCYEKNGVVMTIGSESFHLKLLPAIQSNIPMQGSSEAPNTAPGLHIKIIPNLARLRIPGFAPVYQHLGIDSALVTLVGTFVPEDGENAESFTNVTGFAPPSNINDQTAFNQVRNSELERSSYSAAVKFYDFAVKTGGEVSVYINVPEAVGVENNPFVLNRKPGFKGIIKSMDLFHKNLYRTWYTIQFEVSDFGMYSSTPLDMNQDINEAIQEQVATETQDRAEEDESNLNNRIDGKELISYNDAENPGYFRSGNSYYFRFADRESCRRTFLSVNLGTTVRCNDEQWVEISDITPEQASQFAQNRTLPAGAMIKYPSYETVRDIRRNGYQQFSSDGASIRQVDGSDVTGVEQANIAIQGSICAVSSYQALAAAGVTGFAAASGVGAPAALAGAPTTIGLGAAAAVSCGSWLVSSVKTFTEVKSGAPDTNEGIFEGIVLPIGIDLGTGLVGRAAAPILKEIPGSISNFFKGTSAAADDITITPPGTSQINAPITSPDPTPPSPPVIPAPDPTPPSPPVSSAPDLPASTPRPVTAPPDPAPPGSNGPPSSFTPSTSPVVSAATRSISANDVYVWKPMKVFGVGLGNRRIKLNQLISEENISHLEILFSPGRSAEFINIDSSGNLVASEEVIDLINKKGTLYFFNSGDRLTLY